MLKRFYFLPGRLVSMLISLSPSFRLSSIFLRLLGNNVDISVTFHNKVTILLPRRLTVGANSTINSGCMLDTRSGIKIGKNTMLGNNVKVFTLGHDPDDENFAAKGGEVNIGSNVVIFPNSLIMPGVKIGDRAVIYPGSVVVKDVLEGDIVGGNPAIFIKKRKSTVNYILNYRMYFGV